MKLRQLKINTKICPLYLVASNESLKGVFWSEQKIPMRTSEDVGFEILDETVKQLNEYLDGKRKKFDLPLDAIGTEFQKSVWQQLRQIPYGETRSYKDIAVNMRNAKACRAVGTANGRNPLSIIVPCHRVIASDGTLGGFGGGLDIKSKLLALEKTGKLGN